MVKKGGATVFASSVRMSMNEYYIYFVDHCVFVIQFFDHPDFIIPVS